MKKKATLTFRLVIVSAAFVSLVSCRKNVPEGQLIKANGTTTELTSQEAFAGVKVYLYGGHITYSNGSVAYSEGPLDSAISDASGRFSLQYRAEGNSVDYALSLDNAKAGENVLLPYDFAGPFQVAFNFEHQLSKVDFTVNKTYDLQLHLVIDHLPQDSMYVTIGSDYGLARFYYFLHGQSKDTLLPTKFVPGKTVYVLYRPYDADTLIDGVTYHRELTDTLQLNNRHNEQTEKHIVSTNDFPLHIY